MQAFYGRCAAQGVAHEFPVSVGPVVAWLTYRQSGERRDPSGAPLSPPCAGVARGAHATAFAGKGDEVVLPAVVAPSPGKGNLADHVACVGAVHTAAQDLAVAVPFE